MHGWTFQSILSSTHGLENQCVLIEHAGFLACHLIKSQLSIINLARILYFKFIAKWGADPGGFVLESMLFETQPQSFWKPSNWAGQLNLGLVQCHGWWNMEVSCSVFAKAWQTNLISNIGKNKNNNNNNNNNNNTDCLMLLDAALISSSVPRLCLAIIFLAPTQSQVRSVYNIQKNHALCFFNFSAFLIPFLEFLFCFKKMPILK